MLEQVRSLLTIEIGLKRGHGVLVAVSGGVDSMVLLDIMDRLADDLGGCDYTEFCTGDASGECPPDVQGCLDLDAPENPDDIEPLPESPSDEMSTSGAAVPQTMLGATTCAAAAIIALQ